MTSARPGSVAELLRTDAELDALADHRHSPDGDPVLALLAEWAAEIDSHPMRVTAQPSTADTSPGFGASLAGRAVALTVALTLSSTGVAAAVKGDPWAPLHFVVAKIKTIGHGNDSDLSPLSLQQPNAAGAAADRGEFAASRPSNHMTSRGARPDGTSGSAPSTPSSGVPTQHHASDAGGSASHHRVIHIVTTPRHPHHHQVPTPPVDNPSPRPGPQQDPVPTVPPIGTYPSPDKPGAPDPPPAE